MGAFSYSNSNHLFWSLHKALQADREVLASLGRGSLNLLVSRPSLFDAVKGIESYYAENLTITRENGFRELLPENTPEPVLGKLLEICTLLTTVCRAGSAQAASGSARAHWFVASIAATPELFSKFGEVAQLVDALLGHPSKHKDPLDHQRVYALLSGAVELSKQVAPMLLARGPRTASSALDSIASRLEDLGEARLAFLVDSVSNTLDAI